MTPFSIMLYDESRGLYVLFALMMTNFPATAPPEQEAPQV